MPVAIVAPVVAAVVAPVAVPPAAGPAAALVHLVPRLALPEIAAVPCPIPIAVIGPRILPHDGARRLAPGIAAAITAIAALAGLLLDDLLLLDHLLAPTVAALEARTVEAAIPVS